MPSDPTPLPELTNGRYRVALSPAGGGGSFYEWIALNRWPDDPVADAHGFFIYLRDTETRALWSAGRQPTLAAPDRYEVKSEPGRLVIQRQDHGIACTMAVSVDEKDDVERREVTLHNTTHHARRIEVTSCIEVALAHPMGDLGHPAFSKLFVQTEWRGEPGVLVATRRPRSHGEAWPALFHALDGAAVTAWETDRLHFTGRGNDLAHPAFAMKGTVGNVLDPLFSLRTVIDLAPGESRTLTFLLGATADHGAVNALATRHATHRHPARPTFSSAKAPAIHATGAFSEDGSEFTTTLPWTGRTHALPPMPWCNVMANERFGCLVSERGAGCTWSRNSQANRITPWSNDPVSDPHDEALYLRDEAGGAFWSPLPGPCPAAAEYQATHGFGCSRWTMQAHQLRHRTTVFVPREDPVKLVLLQIINDGPEPRRLSLFSYHRLVLGTLPPPAGTVRTRADAAGVLLAQNTQSAEFGGGTVFQFGIIEGAALTSAAVARDRAAFLGPLGSTRNPRALHEAELAATTGETPDPCFARRWGFTLEPGQTVTCGLVLGEAVGEAELGALIARYQSIAVMERALAEVQAFWREGLGALRVQTPCREIDLMVNGWLAYQALSCRIWGRTAFYQSSGAFGFRDQLQDAGNLTLLWPELTRRQILLHARHQFTEGDVLHWWHEPPIGRGVRTRFSDDLLWLPFITADYVRATGDAAVLEAVEPFLAAPVLHPGEEENYLKPGVSGESASLYEHCCRAIDRSLATGAHGLPLMGTGDWNDGMNRVGRGGLGESVWLGFFLHQILGEFIPLARQRGDEARADRYAAHQTALSTALDADGWDGAWYRRAFYDDGTILGTAAADECRIDGLVQAWSVLSGAARPDRARAAMAEAEKHLINLDEGLIRLLTPPFVTTPEDPGYIKGYVAGVRENGGQYTHASCWVVRAMAKLGRRDLAAALMARLSPVWHTRDQESIDRYKVEPYVIAADVYGAAPHIGRGGWTWYTGSAGWAFRTAVESILGLRIEAGHTLVLQPCLPDDWPRVTLDYRHPATGARYRIQIVNPGACSARICSVLLDGTPQPHSEKEARLLMTDGEHEVVVTLGA